MPIEPFQESSESPELTSDLTPSPTTRPPSRAETTTSSAALPSSAFAIALLLLALGSPAGLAGEKEEEPPPATAADAPAISLTLDTIFSQGKFSAKSYGPARWWEGAAPPVRIPGGDSDDDDDAAAAAAEGSPAYYTTLEKAEGEEGGRDIVLHNAATGEKEVLVASSLLVPPGEDEPLDIDGYRFSRSGARLLIYTNSKRVWRARTRGDYWVLDLSSRELRQLGGPEAKPSTLQFATFSPDGGRVAYVRENDLYVQDLRGLEVIRLTTDGSAEVSNGTFDWVYEEEFGLRNGFRWSPDGRHIAYWKIDATGVRTFYMINNTDGLYPELTPIKYPKAGEVNSACQVGVVPTAGGETCWVDLPGDPRNTYVNRLEWVGSGAGAELAVLQLNRLQNTALLFAADPASGAVREVFTDSDEAWIDARGSPLTWFRDGKGGHAPEFLWRSERDGWRHLYRGGFSEEAENPPDGDLITPGEYDIIQIAGIDEAGGWVYFTASPDDPVRRYLYRARLDGTGSAERITPEDTPGTHSYRLSPDRRWAIHTFSNAETPPLTDLVALPSHEVVRTLEDNAELAAKLDRLRRAPREFFRVEIGDGVALDGWCLKPPDLDPDLSYPVLFYVYGEPAGQTAVDRWSGRRYLWHLLLTHRGYVVMNVDNRGTPSPRGRAWRKSVYRQVGILASADQAAAVRALLAERPYLDPGRVGIWGWSGGGSMTLNALFRYPELYHVGMSVAPVANQRFYDTIYQERYMGLPDDNVEGYRDGSPITFAHQLEGDLLLVHGTADDNVHYQSTEALADVLIRHNKPFSLLAYPNRTHAIREGKNTTRHLYGSLTRFLLDKLPPGPRRLGRRASSSAGGG